MLKKLFKFGKKKEETIENEVAQEEQSNTEEEKSQEEISKNVETVVEDEQKLHTETIEEAITVNEEVEKDSINEEDVIEEAIIKENIEVNNEEEIENIETINQLSEEESQEIVEEEVVEEPEKKVSLFDRLKQGLTKAKQGITDRIDDVLKAYTKVDEELLEELEEILITADVGVNTTMDIIDSLRDKIKQKGITNPMDVREELKNIVEEILTNENSTLDVSNSPTIILMVGVNGVGKLQL